MKTRAGGRLKTRNPRQQPITAPLRITTPVWTVAGRVPIRLIAASRQTAGDDRDDPGGDAVGAVEQVHRHLHARRARRR